MIRLVVVTVKGSGGGAARSEVVMQPPVGGVRRVNSL